MKKFTIGTSVFASILNNGGIYAGTNKLITALDNVCVAVKGGRIRVASSNGNDYIKEFDRVIEGDDMAFCTNAKDIKSYVSLISGDTVDVSLDEERKMVVLKHENGEISLPYSSDDEFPEMREPKNATSIVVSGDTFASWLKKASLFTKQGQLLNAPIEGVHLAVTPEKISVSATDRYCIYYSSVPNNQGVAEFEVTVPRASVNILANVCAGCENVTIESDGNVMKVKTPECVALFILIEGKFPNVPLVISRPLDFSVSINRTALLSSVKRINAQASLNNTICLEGKEGTLAISFVDMTLNKSVKENVPYTGDSLSRIWVDVSFLSKILGAYSADEVEFCHADNAAMPLRFVYKEEDRAEYMMISPKTKPTE